MVGRAAGAVVFDMDGVLFDSEPLHLETLNAVLRDDGITISEDENLRLLGLPVEDVLRELLSRRGRSGSVAGHMERYDTAIVQVFQEKLTASPGVADLLDGLRSRAVPLALASSSKPRWIEAGLDPPGLG